MTMVARRRWEAGPALGGGALAGLLAGLVLSIFMVSMAVARGGDFWMTFKGAGTPFLGERAQQPGFDGTAVAVGLLSHLAVSITWGVLFGALFYGISRGATLFMGLLWGVVVWLGMYYVVLPAVGLTAIREQTPIARAVLSHVAFGFLIALAFLPFQRKIMRPRRAWIDRDERAGRADRPVY